MTTPDISMFEFARRLCARAHPLFSTTGEHVPCGQHQHEAQAFWVLLTAQGTGSLSIITDIRREAGLKS